jgi:hypothetical protein
VRVGDLALGPVEARDDRPADDFPEQLSLFGK